MIKKYIHELIFKGGTLALAAAIPFSIRMSTWCLLVLALNWLVEGNLKQKLKTAYSHSFVIACSLLYLLELCSLFFTRHVQDSFYHLQTEASLLVIPLLYVSHDLLSKRFISIVLRVFCASVFLSSLYCVCIGCIRYFHSGDITFLFYHTLVTPVHQHAVYFSVYTFICMVFLFHRLKEEKAKQFGWLLFLLVYFSVLLFLLRSKMLVGIALAYGIFQLIKIIRSNRASAKHTLVFPVILITGIVLVSQTSNPFSKQIHELEESNLAMLSKQQFNPGIYFNEIELRLLLWKFSLEILHEHHAWLTGVSAGDAKSMINERIITANMYTGIPGRKDTGYLNYNLHDQYLETLFHSGIPGLLLLVWLLFTAINIALKAENELLFFTVTAFALFFITESVFERQIGIVPFFFFTSLWVRLKNDPLRTARVNTGSNKPRLFVDAHSFDKGYQGVCTFIRGVYANPFLAEKAIIYLGAYNIDNLKKTFPGISPQHFIPYKSRHPLVRLMLEIPYILYKHRFDYAHFQYIIPLIRYGKCIVTTHDILFKDFKKDFPISYRILRSFAFKYSFKNADIKTTPSAYSRQRLSFYYGISAEEIHLVPNGIPDDLALGESHHESSVDYIAAKFGVRNFILCVSRIEPRKNQALLLQAYLDMALYRKNIALVFVGSVSIKDVAFNRAWQEIPSCAEQYIKHIREVSQPDLLRLYQAARLFVYPSRAEGFGIPPLEAAALRTPVLCSSSTAMSAYTFFGKNLFDPANEAEFRQKLETVLFSGCRSELDELAEKVRKIYSWTGSAQYLWRCMV